MSRNMENWPLPMVLPVEQEPAMPVSTAVRLRKSPELPHNAQGPIQPRPHEDLETSSTETLAEAEDQSSEEASESSQNVFGGKNRDIRVSTLALLLYSGALCELLKFRNAFRGQVLVC